MPLAIVHVVKSKKMFKHPSYVFTLQAVPNFPIMFRNIFRKCCSDCKTFLNALISAQPKRNCSEEGQNKLKTPVDVTQVVVCEEVDGEWSRVAETLQRRVHVACVAEVPQTGQSSVLTIHITRYTQPTSN